MNAPMIGSTLGHDTARTRKSDPLTSHAAADSISKEGREGSELEVIEILRACPASLTDHHIHQRHLKRWQSSDAKPPHLYSASRLRTARNQLLLAGVVVPDGKGTSETGRQAIAWRLSPEWANQ